MVKKMKKLKIIVLVSFFLLLTGCGGIKSYQEISYEKLLTKLENKETFILYIGSSTCTACESFKPTLESVIKDYQIKVDYLNVEKLSEDELHEFGTIINFGNSTPKVYFIEEGEYSQYNAIKGTHSYDYVVSKMKNNGYIKD